VHCFFDFNSRTIRWDYCRLFKCDIFGNGQQCTYFAVAPQGPNFIPSGSGHCVTYSGSSSYAVCEFSDAGIPFIKNIDRYKCDPLVGVGDD